MLVRATKASKNLGIKIKELGRLANEGETFEVTNSRYRVLAGSNRFNAKFVTQVGPIVPAKAVKIVENNPVSIPKPKATGTEVISTKASIKSTKSKSPAKGQIAPIVKETVVEDLGEPEIILIEPGKKPVKVDKKLKPIVEEKDAKLDTVEE